MLRIRGKVGDWPVDLTVEMDAEDWDQLASRLSPETVAQAAPAAAKAPLAPRSDALWDTAQQLLCEAGRMEGPRLLAELEALAGGAAAGKRLLVRLRHSEQVHVDAGKDAPIYVWKG
ncbi:hypothetical protein [Metapseudomonas resinovorans]|uniref:Uncharacterized protein n=1 Tax=Metapseudomonas resinovorans NBRC 106553 TaxID=1245471 RepID=S6AFA5_METRE|nr:hypothetical protein [Pseudomonas resinovorans]BAN46400.1 hypothetical protein PCA10_06680 [Pseudomonas resinovorans NBRC 106553]